MASLLNTIFVTSYFRIIALSYPFTNIPRKRRKNASLNYERSRNITRLESVNNRRFYELISKLFIKLLFYDLLVYYILFILSLQTCKKCRYCSLNKK